MFDAENDLAARVAQLERRLRTTIFAATAIFICGLIILIGTVDGKAVAVAGTKQSSQVLNVLRVRELDVVDRNGVTRVKLASPLPAPIVAGKQLKSRGGSPEDTMSGMLLFDATGAERSGYTTVDRGYSNVMLTLDDKNSGQHALFITEPEGGTTLRLFNADTKDRLDLAISKNGPSISMIRDGKELVRQPMK